MKIESLVSPRWIITADKNDRVLENHTLLIDQGRIIDILPTASARQQVQARQQYHLPQHALMPGLINAHTHAAMSLMRGLADDLSLMPWLREHIWPVEARWGSKAFVYDGSRLALLEMLRSGTTCFNDMYFFPQATARAVREAGMRTVIGLIMLDFPSTYAPGPEQYLQKALALHEALKPAPLIHTAFAPHAPYTVSDPPLLQLRDDARRLGIPIHMHVHETAAEVAQAQENGERPLARLQRLGLLDQHFMAVHMTRLKPDEIEHLASAGVHVIHCPESNLKLASGFCPVAKLQAAGVNVALGTDGAASNNDLDMLGEMKTAALLGKAVAADAAALPARDMIRMATINGARALGLEQITGSLETGKSADMIAVNFGEPESVPLYDPVSHLVYCTTRNQITHAWVAGRLLMDNRRLTTLDEADIMEKAKSWQHRLESTHA
ncbi:MAG: TRZ/ATZ family hydrolase [Thiothrix sp.]|nr:TRZ/ATZ family hydrolase [Thiothrix sp.]